MSTPDKSWISKLPPEAQATLAANPHLREKLERNPPPPWDPPKPKPVRAVAVPVSEALAEAAKANPESVRVAARDADGRHIVEGPWRPRPEGRMVYNGPSSAVGWMGWGRQSDPGLWFEPDQSGGAKSAYDPVARFEKEIKG
jgi:hypothetical protein